LAAGYEAFAPPAFPPSPFLASPPPAEAPPPPASDSSCAAQEEIEDSGSIVAMNTGDFGALGWGAVSLVCNLFLIPSVLAWVCGVRDLRMTQGVTTPEASSIRTKAIFGLILGSVGPAMLVGMVFIAIVAAALTPSHEPYDYDPYGPSYESAYPYNPGAYDPGVYAPGTYDPGTYDPGTYDPGTYDPGTYDASNPGTADEQMQQLLRILEEMEQPPPVADVPRESNVPVP
jgi:hypothetical protein